MFLHYNLRRAKCLRHTDSGSTSEFYFTWRAYIDGSESVQLAQGFSLGWTTATRCAEVIRAS
jgi:hypothetical protein